MSARDTGTDRGGAETFGDLLSTLKSRGCSLLVDGEVPESTSRRMTRKLFGAPGERRERLLVRLKPTRSVDGWFPGDLDAGHDGVRIVDFTDLSRSATVDAGTEAAPTGSSIGITGSEPPVDALTEELSDELRAAVDDAAPLAAAQLRVGVYPLDVIVDRYGLERAVEFVSAVRDIVVDRAGMVHFHYLQPPSNERVATLATEVDVEVALRRQGADRPAEHRWVLDGYGATEWLPLR